MRQLKFRVWNPIKKIMLGENQGQIVIRLDGRLRDSHTGHGAFCEEERNPDWPVMQFTGLKDKNNQEIYEGDIVEAGNNKEKFKVVFGIAQYYLINDNDVSAMDAFEFIGDYTQNQKLLQVEVISNIFELDKS